MIRELEINSVSGLRVPNFLKLTQNGFLNCQTGYQDFRKNARLWLSCSLIFVKRGKVIEEVGRKILQPTILFKISLEELLGIEDPLFSRL